MCSMYEGMRNSSRGKIIVGKDIVNVRWGSSVTSVENANVQQPTAPQGVVEEADDGITLMDLFKIIRKHLVTAIIAFVVVVAGVSAYTFLAPAKYTATAQTMATYNASDGGESIAQQSTGGSYISNQITSYPTLATTSKVLKPVIDDLGLDETVTDLAGQVTVTNPTNTAFVNIAVVDGDPKQAADIANSVAESLKNVIESDLYSGDKSPVKLSIVQKAQVPTSKSSPKTALYLAVGVVLGIIIGVFAALIKDLLNTKVEETSDVRSIVRASSLGSVPMDASLDDKRPVLVSQPNGAIAEEFRRIHPKAWASCLSSRLRSRPKARPPWLSTLRWPLLKMVRKYCLSTLISATRPLLTTWALKVPPVWRTCCPDRWARRTWCRATGSRTCTFCLAARGRRTLACC